MVLMASTGRTKTALFIVLAFTALQCRASSFRSPEARHRRLGLHWDSPGTRRELGEEAQWKAEDTRQRLGTGSGVHPLDPIEDYRDLDVPGLKALPRGLATPLLLSRVEASGQDSAGDAQGPPQGAAGTKMCEADGEHACQALPHHSLPACAVCSFPCCFRIPGLGPSGDSHMVAGQGAASHGNACAVPRYSIHSNRQSHL